jgi:hypothetical protein
MDQPNPANSMLTKLFLRHGLQTVYQINWEAEIRAGRVQKEQLNSII